MKTEKKAVSKKKTAKVNTINKRKAEKVSIKKKSVVITEANNG